MATNNQPPLVPIIDQFNDFFWKKCFLILLYEKWKLWVNLQSLKPQKKNITY